jgi:hypothetical protein
MSRLPPSSPSKNWPVPTKRRLRPPRSFGANRLKQRSSAAGVLPFTSPGISQPGGSFQRRSTRSESFAERNRFFSRCGQGGRRVRAIVFGFSTGSLSGPTPCFETARPYWLWKDSERQVNSPKSPPQGLKSTLYYQHLAARVKSFPVTTLDSSGVLPLPLQPCRNQHEMKTGFRSP